MHLSFQVLNTGYHIASAINLFPTYFLYRYLLAIEDLRLRLRQEVQDSQFGPSTAPLLYMASHAAVQEPLCPCAKGKLIDMIDDHLKAALKLEDDGVLVKSVSQTDADRELQCATAWTLFCSKCWMDLYWLAVHFTVKRKHFATCINCMELVPHMPTLVELLDGLEGLREAVANKTPTNLHSCCQEGLRGAVESYPHKVGTAMINRRCKSCCPPCTLRILQKLNRLEPHSP
jgi:hypothetical protein